MPQKDTLALLALLGAIGCGSETGDGPLAPEVMIVGAEVAEGAPVLDFNGDGYADVALVADRGENLAGFNGPSPTRGRVHVLLGPLGEARYVIGENAPGVAISGDHETHEIGAVTAVGDTNGDGLDDLLIGADQRCIWEEGCYEGNCNGQCSNGPFQSYLLFGRIDAADASLAEISGERGYAISGAPLEWQTLAALGDVNGDGLADFAVGDAVGTDLVYVVFGKANAAPVDLAQVAAGQGGFAIEQEPELYLTPALASAGDVNGDGLADIVIGQPQAGGDPIVGRAYVVFGKASTERVLLADVAAGSGGFAMQGEINGGPTPCCGETGLAVGGGGDANGDGLDDIVVTAPYFQLQDGPPPGRAYVVFGQQSGDMVMLAEVAQGQGGYALDGYSDLGHDVAERLVDLGGDGLADMLIRDNGEDAYLVPGRAQGQAASPVDGERIFPSTPGSWYVGRGSMVARPGDQAAIDLVLSGSDEEQRAATLLIRR